MTNDVTNDDEYREWLLKQLADHMPDILSYCHAFSEDYCCWYRVTVCRGTNFYGTPIGGYNAVEMWVENRQRLTARRFFARAICAHFLYAYEARDFAKLLRAVVPAHLALSGVKMIYAKTGKEGWGW